MRARVQKWGNSLAVRIPKAFAVQARLKEHASVDISVVDGKLMVVPIAQPELTLDALLAQVTDENLHGEVESGPAVGKEAW